VRARLIVQLFECVEHYAGVCGCAFVRHAVAALLLESSPSHVEVLLPLLADHVRAAVVVAAYGTQPLFVPPTVSTYGKREIATVVWFEKAPGVWHVGRLRGRPPPWQHQALACVKPSAVFARLRTGEHGSSVSVDNLLCLVGGACDRFLSGDAIRALLPLAVRGFDGGAVVLEPLVDTSTAQGREMLANNVRHKRNECAKVGAARLLVPWNNMSGHWTLMVLDVAAQTASYVDSLHTARQSPPRELRTVCRLFFGEQWTGSIKVLPSPQQPDAHNCGVYVVLNAWHLARALPLPREYPPAEGVRLWLARCWLLDRALEWCDGSFVH
jgi:hypothetical protein